MGQFDAASGGRILLVENVARRRTPGGARSGAPRVRHADHAVGRRHRRRSSRRCSGASRRSPAPRKEDICYATQNRQDAVKQLLEHCDVLLVVGSRSSSNSNRLRELADRARCRAIWSMAPRTCAANGLRTAHGRCHGRRFGTRAAGAGVVSRLREWGGAPPAESDGRPEHVVFALPRALR